MKPGAKKLESATWLWSDGRYVRQSSSEKQADARDCSLLYKRARYYDPSTGEFISRDPLEYVDGMSLYRGYFVPALTDPTGEGIQFGIPALLIATACAAVCVNCAVQTVFRKKKPTTIGAAVACGSCIACAACVVGGCALVSGGTAGPLCWIAAAAGAGCACSLLIGWSNDNDVACCTFKSGWGTVFTEKIVCRSGQSAFSCCRNRAETIFHTWEILEASFSKCTTTGKRR